MKDESSAVTKFFRPHPHFEIISLYSVFFCTTTNTGLSHDRCPVMLRSPGSVSNMAAFFLSRHQVFCQCKIVQKQKTYYGCSTDTPYRHSSRKQGLNFKSYVYSEIKLTVKLYFPRIEKLSHNALKLKHSV